MFNPKNSANRRLYAAFILLCAASALGLVAAERWVLVGAVVYAVLPLGSILIGLKMNSRDRRR